MPEPELPPQAAPPPLIHNLTYTGRTSELFALFLVNLLLTVLSLGVYRFWGKVRMRRYLWSHLLLQGEPFGYTGNGKELFKGFIKVLFLLIIPAVLVWQAIAMMTWAAVESLSFVIILAIISPYLVFVVRRYRLSRSDWRCIRFAQTGEPREYAKRAVKGWLLNMITLFWYVPTNASHLFDYQINRIRFGTMRFTYDGTPADIKSSYRVIWLSVFILSLLSVGIAVGAVTATFIAIHSSHQKLLDVIRNPHYLVIMLLQVPLMFLSLLVFSIGRIKYRLLLYRHVAEHTRLGAMQARFGATFWQFLRLNIGNFLLKAISFGLLSPIAAHRRMKFLCRHLRLRDLPDFDSVRQIPAADRTGEGWSHWLDFDALDF